MKDEATKGTYERIYAAVRRVPRGRVATYGQIATIAGLTGHARQVGYALNELPENTRVPWQRVINAQGRLSPRAMPGESDHQRCVLESEGIPVQLAGGTSAGAFGELPRDALNVDVLVPAERAEEARIVHARVNAQRVYEGEETLTP